MLIIGSVVQFPAPLVTCWIVLGKTLLTHRCISVSYVSEPMPIRYKSTIYVQTIYT